MKPQSPRDGGESKGTLPPRGSFVQTIKAIGWSFFGVRKSADHERLGQLNPVHVVIAGVAGAVLFVVVLVLLVRFIINSGVAT